MFKEKQDLDPTLIELKRLVVERKVGIFSKGEDSVLRYQGQLCLLNVDGLRGMILSEAYDSWHFIHLRSTKMCRDLREVYW